MSIWEILNNKWSHLGKIKKIVEILEKIRYHNPMKLEKILINRKHEMFWNTIAIIRAGEVIYINRKHEMFWNGLLNPFLAIFPPINRKHEMFWNFSMSW